MAEYFIAYEDAVHDLLAAAAYIGERIKSGDGRASAMTAIVPRYLSRNNVDLAAELANTVDDPFTRDKLLTETAEKCAEIDDDEYALQLAESVEEFGLQQQALERIALEKIRKGQVGKAFETAESIHHPDYVYAAAAVHASANGKPEEAKGFLDKTEFASAKVSALQAMAMSEFAGGNKPACVDLLNDAQATAAEIEHNEERIRTFCEIGNHFVEAGRNDLAIKAYDTARGEAEQLDNVHRDAFIAAAVMGFLHAGSMDTADRTLDLISDKTQMSNCLLAFSKYLWERGEKDEAIDALDESYQILRSQKETETRDSKSRFALLGSIAVQNAEFEKAERAIEIASSIEDNDHRTSALTQLSAVFTLRREDEYARRALNEISDDSERAYALISMSDAEEQLSERVPANQLLEEAFHLIDEVPQLTARSMAYNEIARRFLERGETQQAAEIFTVSLRTVGDVRDESTRAINLATLSDLLVGGGIELTDEQQQMVENLLSRK